MMKKCILIVTVLLMLLSVPAHASGNDVTVKINGKTIQFDVTPTMVNGTAMVPLRKISEKLGAKVTGDAKAKVYKIVDDETTLTLTMGSKTVQSHENGLNNTIELDAPAKMIDGTPMVPLDFFAETFWCNVSWDAKKRTANIITPDKFKTSITKRDGQVSASDDVVDITLIDPLGSGMYWNYKESNGESLRNVLDEPSSAVSSDKWHYLSFWTVKPGIVEMIFVARNVPKGKHYDSYRLTFKVNDDLTVQNISTKAKP